MSETNDIALVPKPPRAIKKSQLGGQRVLSDMVADTLALVKKRQPEKPVFTVLNGGGDVMNEFVQSLIQDELGKRYDLKFIPFTTERELFDLAESHPFDLVFLYLWGVFGVLHAETIDHAIQVLGQFKLKYRKPIIVEQGLDLTKQFEEVGITFLQAPFMIEQFKLGLQACLGTSRETTTS